MGNFRQIREGGAAAAVSGRDPGGDRAGNATRQERHDDAVEAHVRQGESVLFLWSPQPPYLAL